MKEIERYEKVIDLRFNREIEYFENIKTSFLYVPFFNWWNIKYDEKHLFYKDESFFLYKKDFLILNNLKFKKYDGNSKKWPDFTFKNNKNLNFAIEIKQITPEIFKNCVPYFYKRIGINSEYDFNKKYNLAINSYDNKFNFCLKKSYKKQIEQFDTDFLNRKIEYLLKSSIKKINSSVKNKNNIEKFKIYNKKYLRFVFY